MLVMVFSLRNDCVSRVFLKLLVSTYCVSSYIDMSQVTK